MLSTQFGSLAHLAFVRHGVCAEHGDLVHTFGDASEQHAVDTEGQGIDSASRGTQTGGDGDAHDHCTLATTARDGALIGAQAPAARTLAPTAAPRTPDSQLDRSIERARYRLAPKTSPPA